MFRRSGYSAHTRRARASRTQHHHRAADVLLGGADRHGARGTESVPASLLAERTRAETGEDHEVAFGHVLAAAGRDDHALAFDPHPAGAHRDPYRATHVQDPV